MNPTTGNWQPNDVALMDAIMDRTKKTSKAMDEINTILGEW